MVLANDRRRTTNNPMRIFIALDIDDAIRQRIQRFMEGRERVRAGCALGPS